MDLLEASWPYLAALLPSIGLLYLFYVVMKHIVEGDRRERAAQRQWDIDHGMNGHSGGPGRPGPRNGP